MIVRLAFIIVVAWMMAAAVAWFSDSSAITPAPQPSPSRGADLELPTRGSVRRATDQLNRHGIWAVAVAAPVEQSAPVAETWTRVAFVKERNAMAVLLASPSGQTQRFGVGDTLPDGSRLLAVTPHGVTVRGADGKSQNHPFLN
ncbi:hypothetical protein ACDA63_15135 [Uliginosibacterium sp. sgz301328]|uniref:hypothetical protein n=1 Tax=Uliginosibacterium sp. sgz301328 TaxID=3243764 RepID=UPI00359E6481